MITEKELERLENLPKRMGFRKQFTLDDRGGWRRWLYFKNDYYSIAERIIKNNIGKPFDTTFSYFCKKINYNQFAYNCFLDKFSFDNARRRWRFYTEYYGYWVDDNRLIQETKYPRTTCPYIWKSPDYKSERCYAFDDKLVSKVNWQEEKQRLSKGDYVYVKVISGYTQEYAQNSAFAIKSKTESRKKHTKFERDNDIWDKKSKEADWVLRNKKQLAKEKEREEDRIRMEALGFDSNSFKGIEYHGQKRKLKNND